MAAIVVTEPVSAFGPPVVVVDVAAVVGWGEPTVDGVIVVRAMPAVVGVVGVSVAVSFGLCSDIGVDADAVFAPVRHAGAATIRAMAAVALVSSPRRV